MGNPWVAEVWRVVWLAIAATFVGLLLGDVELLLLLALLGYLTWHVVTLYRLYRWLQAGRKAAPPDASGIWEDVIHSIYRVQRRDQRRKRKLAKMLKRFQEFTSAMPDGTVILNELGDILWFNSMAEEMLGLRPHQDVGQRLDNLVRHPRFIGYLKSNRYHEPMEFPSPVNAERVLSLRVIPYGKDQRLVVVRDISHLRKLENMRRDFIANVSHELRTPLTVINGFLETMEDSADPGLASWHRSLQLMRQQTARMQNMVEDVMLLSRLETADPNAAMEDVSVPAMLASIRDDAVLLSGDKQHDIRLEVDGDLWIRGHTRELHSAFSNLVFNAVKYTPPGGSIRVRWYGDKQGAHLEVTDTGMGIPREHLPRLTERFYRVDVARSRESGGTGLGLAIVKHVLNRHQGRLRVDSEPGKGSTFICDFPAQMVLSRLATA